MPDPISAISSGASAQSAAGGLASRDDFLRLLVTQMQHQDPLNPESDTAYVAQLAQFATLEQAQNQTQLLGELRSQLGASAGTQAVALVGHEVTARYDAVQLGQAGAAPVNFTLDGAADRVTITIKDRSGRVIRTLPAGPLAPGVHSVSWNGRDAAGVQQPQGAYRVELVAADSKGGPVGIRPEVRGLVTGISYEQGYPELLVGGSRVQLPDIIEVLK